MKSFEYTIKDELGIHARPAGLLVKKANEFASKVPIKKGEKSADAKRIFAVMGMGVKHGDTVTVSIDGTDEETAFAELQTFFQQNL